MRESLLHAHDDTPLHVVDWLLETTPPAGGIVLMHGLGEHAGRYQHVVRFLNDCGWSIRTFDHRGHGRSGGARGNVPNDDAIMRDAKIVIDDFAQQIGTPPLLFGHSMGGLFAAHFAMRRYAPLSGLILSSPALTLPMTTVHSLLFTILKAVAPDLAISNSIKSRWLSHDPAVVAAYDNDPLVHAKISARLLGSMLGAIDFCHVHAAELRIPTLMLVAGDDRVVDNSGSSRFFQDLAAGIGTFHVYPDLYHEVLNEMNAGRVFDDMRAWLEVRTRISAPSFAEDAHPGCFSASCINLNT